MSMFGWERGPQPLARPGASPVLSTGADRTAHGTVNHRKGEYVRGPVHTNTIEGFWSIIKRSISGTHIHVSPKHLPKYLGEFEFRFNMRKTPDLMFDRLLKAF